MEFLKQNAMLIALVIGSAGMLLWPLITRGK